MTAQPKKTHLFLTLEDLVKIFKYRKTPIKVNKVWYEENIEAMREAGIDIDSESDELIDQEVSEKALDSETISDKELQETPPTKPSGAVSFYKSED